MSSAFKINTITAIIPVFLTTRELRPTRFSPVSRDISAPGNAPPAPVVVSRRTRFVLSAACSVEFRTQCLKGIVMVCNIQLWKSRQEMGCYCCCLLLFINNVNTNKVFFFISAKIRLKIRPRLFKALGTLTW